MQVSQALNPRRISRSLVAILVLTLIQSVAAPVLAPVLTTPAAKAVEVTYSSATRGTDIVVPAGVSSVTLTARGGAGGTGGKDASLGLAGSKVGYVSGTFSVSPGDRITMFPGGAGGNGANDAQNGGGGTPGQTSIDTQTNNSLTPTFKFDGVYSSVIAISGGKGGNAGNAGTSGGGGGGGAGSLVAINEDVALVAAGAGGGAGGSGPTAQPAKTPWTSTNVALGGDGAFGGGCGNGDGGGGGGGGGGWKGGIGGVSTQPSAGSECQGFGGAPGANFVASNVQTPPTNNVDTTPSGAGAITYVFNYDSVVSCATDVQIIEIYTVVKITKTGDCTWSVPATVSVIDLFLVGGGGGGAGDGGSGGNGGAALSRSAVAVTPNSSLRVKAGYGGAGTAWNYTSKAYAGDSTTVVTSTGNVFYALGGATGNTGVSQSPGTVATPQSGAFAGGQGGTASTGLNTVGGAGKRGVSNYFYGIQNTYAGGGGGGIYTNSTASAMNGGAASDGGGAGATESAGGVNSSGSNGTAASGGGGGGGVAVGTGYRVAGGKGGSGVILIRYATNSDDAFPASLTSALSYKFSPGDLQVLDSSRMGWIDSSGNNASVPHANFTGTPTVVAQGTTDAGVSTGANKTDLVVRVTNAQKINLLNLQTGYTLFHVARYVQGGTVDRIISATGSNWLSGFDAGELVTYHEGYVGSGSGGKTYKWRLTTDQAKLYRSEGVDVSYWDDSVAGAATSVTGFGINQTANRNSDAQVSDIIIFNRELTIGEIRAMENYLARIHGLTLSPYYSTSETDTAFNPSGLDFLTQKDIRNNLSDTFTVEFWLKPTNACNTNVCTIIATENSFRFVIRNGKFEYILKGTDAWAWVPTGISVTASEWHHLAISKELTGNRNDSVKVYLDGKLVYTKIGSPYVTSTTAVASPSDSNSIAQVSNSRRVIGCIDSGAERFTGLIDEVKIWNGYRTASQVASDMNSNDGSSPLMQSYYDFNAVQGARINDFKIPNLAYGGGPRSDLFASTAMTSFVFNDVKDVTSDSTYTTLKFSRSYITQYGGWKKPDSITAVSTLLVGGGGGGGWNSGSGGSGGGFLETLTTLSSSYINVTVGMGGRASVSTGGSQLNPLIAPTTGDSTSLAGITVAGGNPGTYNTGSGTPAGGVSVSGSGAGGNGSSSGSTAGGAGGAGRSSSYSGTVTNYSGGGGGGAWNISSAAGAGGLGGGGAGGGGSSTSGLSGAANTGGGGGASSARVDAGFGGSGVVVLRYITALKPTYTKPTTAYLNVGMTETFTTNVAVDSATVGLTRTFKWESTTPTSNGAYTTLKTGTGASNASFSWIPSDTSTSGSGYLYRLTVTDSDTAGLFITDSSTAFAVINQPLNVSGISSLTKKINISQSETFTITLGTPTYRASLSPVIPGITLDTSTAGFAVLKIAETATVGTWLETLTVTDSVSANFLVPLSITIKAPPNLLNTSEIVNNGLVLNLVAGNSQSVILGDGSRTTAAQWNDLSGNGKHASTGGTTETDFYTGRGCTSPTYSTSNGGYLTFDGVNNCYHSPYLGNQFNKSFSVEGWFRLDGDSLNTTGVIASQNIVGNSNINFVLGDALENKTISVGFYNGYWKRTATGYSPVKGQWTHYLGTYDGQYLRLYVNGKLEISTSMTESLGSTVNTSGTWIGRRWDSDNYINGSIGEVRVYNIPLTETEVATNFNATKYRFKDVPSNILKPSKKYGTLVLESFTATSGSDTKTITFAVGDRAGIDWDVSTVPNRVNLSVQESLTVGTYYDTITVTDSLGQSTFLPISFTVTKADTITVTMGTAHTAVFAGTAPAGAPRASISGLVGVDTATVETQYSGTYIDSSLTCAQGGSCSVGDVGPGGGRIFYISSTPINAASGVSNGGIYLEAAPRNWNGDGSGEAGSSFASVLTNVNGTSSAIGTGAENSRILRQELGDSATAATKALNRSFNGVDDWFVPSYDELTRMITVLKPLGLGSFDNPVNLWSSTQNTNTSKSNNAWSSNPPVLNELLKTDNYFLRPIRAFSPTYNSTVTPTEVDTYTAKGTNLTFQVGAASNYQAVIYDTSTLKITQANQDKLTLNLYGAVAGSPFTLIVGGGSGTGTRTETITAGSTAANCRFSNGQLLNDTPKTEQKTCNISITKASSRNYKAETLTATVYFMTFVNNQPTGLVGSGSTIALNGETSLSIADTATVRAPLVSSVTSTISRSGGGSITIGGEGFGAAGTSVTLKFWRNKMYITTTSSDSSIVVSALAIPSDATSGPILVITAHGEASTPSVTITP